MHREMHIGSSATAWLHLGQELVDSAEHKKAALFCAPRLKPSANTLQNQIPHIWTASHFLCPEMGEQFNNDFVLRVGRVLIQKTPV